MKNMQRFLIMVGFLLTVHIAAAQNSEERYRKIESAKIALITERLQLTPAQAEKFWPVYNQYQKEKQLLRRSTHQEKKEMVENLSEKEANELLNKRLEAKKQELALDDKFIPLMIQATSAKQIVALERAEVEFRRMLLRRMRDRTK